MPRLSTPIVVFDDGEGIAWQAGERLLALGYQNAALLQDGLQGWRNAGYEVFRDVNAPSKAFGELVESQRNTPSLSPKEVNTLIESRADIVILDVRQFDEFQVMSIPTATSVLGAEPMDCQRRRARAQARNANHCELCRPHAQHHRNTNTD